MWRPSAGTPPDHVLVDPRVMVDSLLYPYYWTSTPGVRNFSLTIHLEQPTQVGRVRVNLLTPAPSDSLVIQSEAPDGRWQTWSMFSYKCPKVPLGVACIKPPSTSWPATSTTRKTDLCTLDTRLGEGGTTPMVPTPSTRRLRLVFTGYPHTDPVSTLTPTLTQHVVAEIQAFTLATRPGYIVTEVGHGAELQAMPRHFDNEIIRIRRGGRYRRTGHPKGFYYPGYAPANGRGIFRLITKGQLELGPPNVTVTLGKVSCDCDAEVMDRLYPRWATKPTNLTDQGCNTDDVVLCRLGDGSDVINIPQNIMITTTTGRYPTDISFTFKPNPRITDIYPNFQYHLGRRWVTITGENLDSGVEPKFYLITTTSGGSVHRGTRVSHNCRLENSTTLYCLSPDADIPKSYQRGKRSASGRYLPEEHRGIFMNDPKEMTVKIEVEIGGYNITKANRKLLGQRAIMYIAPKPKFEEFPGGQFDLKFYEFDDPKLHISGHRMSLAAYPTDYTVTVGGKPCNVTELMDNQVTCKPPAEKDIPIGPHARNDDGYPRVQIRVFEMANFTPGVIRYLHSKPIDWNLIGIGIAVILSGLTLFLIIFYCMRQHDQQKALEEQLKRLSTDYQRLLRAENKTLLQAIDPTLRYKVNDCILEYHRIKQGMQIGNGNFGKVYAGKLTTQTDNHIAEKKIAIKTVKDTDVALGQLEDFLKEAVIMCEFDHPNVLNLIGVAIKNDRPFVVLPFMVNGDLKDYVSDENRNFNLVGLLTLVIDVAKGMEYLSGKGSIHRDLRAANCMVDGEFVVKVGDFGLAREVDRDSGEYKVNYATRPMPVRWLAPECLEDNKYTVFSDVWSFGILMWEVLTRGSRPYLEVENHHVRDHVLSGGRLEKPDYCPDKVYEIMMKCWTTDCKYRPRFNQLSTMLQAEHNVLKGGDRMRQQPVQIGRYVKPSRESDYADIQRRRATNLYNDEPEGMTSNRQDNQDYLQPVSHDHSIELSERNPANADAGHLHGRMNDCRGDNPSTAWPRESAPVPDGLAKSRDSTPDYCNQPAHLKRVPQKSAPSHQQVLDDGAYCPVAPTNREILSNGPDSGNRTPWQDHDNHLGALEDEYVPPSDDLAQSRDSTADYTNQPAHLKRVPKQSTPVRKQVSAEEYCEVTASPGEILKNGPDWG